MEGQKVKGILIIFFGLIPSSIQIALPNSFDCWKDYSRFYRMQKYHGMCAVSTDFIHFIRPNGELCNG